MMVHVIMLQLLYYNIMLSCMYKKAALNLYQALLYLH